MEKIGICGAGLIGASWAIGFANAGYISFVYDNNVNSVENFNNYFEYGSFPVSSYMTFLYSDLSLETVFYIERVFYCVEV